MKEQQRKPLSPRSPTTINTWDDETLAQPPPGTVEGRLQEQVKSLKKKVAKKQAKITKKSRHSGDKTVEGQINPSTEDLTPKMRNESPWRRKQEKTTEAQQQQDVAPENSESHRPLSISTNECVLKAIASQDAPAVPCEVETPSSMVPPPPLSSSTNPVFAAVMPQIAVDMPPLSPLTAATSMATATDPSSPKVTNNKKKQQLTPKKKKGKSWLRKALTAIESPRHAAKGMPNTVKGTPNNTPKDAPPPRYTHETSPLQQQLWLAAIRQSMMEAQVAQSLLAEREAQKEEPQDEEREPLQLTKYYHEQREAGIVMDYSTFDEDAESVSSIELLFNWMSCREIGKDQMRIDHRGKLVIATDSELSDALSWHEGQKSSKHVMYTQG